MSNTSSGSDSSSGEACPADLPEQPTAGGASENSPTIHVETKSGTTVRTNTSGPRPTH